MPRILIVCSLMSALVFTSPGGFAADKPVNKQQAAMIAKTQFKGRVIAVDEGAQNSNHTYRVKVLDKQGGMHTVVIDARTGKVISAH